ncbi:MAG: diaminopimelate epimerase [Bacteroidales bacterium]|nr:diaminopimelate epimerase [Bacteroidales bacterium]
MELYKYQGAGNDFLLADNRDGGFTPDVAVISSLCDRHYGIGADGIMLLGTDPNHDFKMVYYNSDGTGGMMCGNGGRCIVAFAADLGIHPKNGKTYEFIADDGPHSAEILDSAATVIRLKMKDVEEVKNIDVKSYFLDTGTRHFVRFVSGLQTYDVFHEGREIRNLPQFAPIGTNVNFVEAIDGILNVRTYEKGVEDETYACGTGITASAIAALRHFTTDPEARAAIGRTIERRPNAHSELNPNVADRIHIEVKALRDRLAVDFVETATGAADVWLTGPATFVCKICF